MRMHFKFVPFVNFWNILVLFRSEINKIKPFYFANQGDPAYLAKDEFEEQIITNGKNFPIYPYLKKVDLFVKDKEEEEVNKVIDFLDEKNINYEIHIGEYRP